MGEKRSRSGGFHGRFQERIINIPGRARRVKSAGIGRVERSVYRQATGQIWIRDEENSESDRIGFAGLEHLLRPWIW